MKLFQFENKAGKVKLNDLVTKWSADEIIQEMGKLFGSKAVDEGMNICGVTACAENAVDTLEIEINSPGGSVLDGHRIYQELRAMRDRGVYVIAKINSLAASMGSVVAMAADEIRMVKGGRLMIHEASQSVHGTAKDHQRAANLLESMTNEIGQIYAERSGQPLATVREMMADETWLGAEDAKEAGFVDVVLDGDRVDTKEETKAAAPQPTDLMFEKRSELKAQIEALTEDVEEAGKLVADAEARAQEFADKVADLELAIAKLESEKAEAVQADAEKAVVIAEAEAEKDELKKAAEITDLKVAEAAVKELAAIGHEPVEELSSEAFTIGALTREQFDAEYNSIKSGKARSKWFLANKHRLTE